MCVFCVVMPAAAATKGRSSPGLTLLKDFTPERYERVPPSSWWWSEKLDGWRAYWDGKRLITRSGRLLQPPEAWASRMPSTPLDGELYLGRGTLYELGGILRSKEGGGRYPQWSRVRFWAFDLPQAKGGYPARYRRLQALVARTPKPTPLRLVKQTPVASIPPDRLAADIMDRGGEGVVLRNVDDATQPYQRGRTADVLKVKERSAGEARVDEVVRTRDGRLQALKVRRSGVVRSPAFHLGTGFTDAQRRRPAAFNAGDRVTFAYTGLTPQGVPRHATYTGRAPSK